MKHILTALSLVALASTAFAAHEAATSPDFHCLPPTVHHVLAFS